METQYQSTGDKIELLESQVVITKHNLKHHHTCEYSFVGSAIPPCYHLFASLGCRGKENCWGIWRQVWGDCSQTGKRGEGCKKCFFVGVSQWWIWFFKTSYKQSKQSIEQWAVCKCFHWWSNKEQLNNSHTKKTPLLGKEEICFFCKKKCIYEYVYGFKEANPWKRISNLHSKTTININNNKTKVVLPGSGRAPQGQSRGKSSQEWC